MWPRRYLHLAKGDAPEGNMMAKRIERDDTDIDVRAQQQEENDRIPVTTIWKWSTPEEASAFLEGVDRQGEPVRRACS